MKGKKFFAYILVVILFVVYLFSANSIILMADDNETLAKVEFERYAEKDPVYQMVDGFQYLGGLREVAYFQGWAYCETERDNADKTIELVFLSEDGSSCYAVETKAQSRDDVYGAFRDTMKIYNGMNGVECQFSTINMKNGQYRYYVAVIENGVNYGIVDTGMLFEKDVNGLHQVGLDG